MRPFVIRAAALGALLSTIPFTAQAAGTMMGAQDTTFAIKAAQAGMTEVKLATLAGDKSKNPAVLSFAREMKADHTKANSQLMTIVKSKGMTVPASLGMKNQALMTQLQAQSGQAFDTQYLKSQLTAHQSVLALFRSEATNGKDSDLVAFAKQTIPVIVSHIAMDKSDAAKVGSVGMKMPMNQ